MYALLPYVWLLFMLGLVVATITVAMMGRPKKVPKKKTAPGSESAEAPASDAEPSLDFGDELAQMENK
jgi:hypothetical protein